MGEVSKRMAGVQRRRDRRWSEAADDPDARAAAWADWETNAHEPQRPPLGDWSTWLFLGGRGAGKTRAGAEWLSRKAEPEARLAIVGQSLDAVRAVMVEGESGLIACAKAETLRPRWESSRRRVLWPNGAFAEAFSAEDADALRGPQFHFAWCDEWAAWKRPEHALAMLRMGLRLGERPQVMISTTPKPHGALRRLMAEAGTVISRGATSLNAKFLAPSFLSDLERRYGGTRLGRQELEGIVVEGDGAPLWRAEQLSACHGEAPSAASGRSPFDRIVVAVDPPAGSGEGSACGIIVAGRLGERGYVLADRTVERATPAQWADAVKRAAAAFGATAVTAEANQGGEMVKAVLTGAGVTLPVKLVRASEGKRARAEPVAALYEQGRVTHCAPMPELEEQMLGLGAEEEAARGEGWVSPDRADALVWGLSELMLGPAREGPRVRWVDW